MSLSDILDRHPASTRDEGAAGVQSANYRLGQLTFVSVDPNTLFSVPVGQLRHVVTVNAEIFVYAHEDARFARLLQRTTNTVDGRIVQLLSALFSRQRLPRKLSGSDFIYDLTARCALNGDRLFLLGASEASNTD